MNARPPSYGESEGPVMYADHLSNEDSHVGYSTISLSLVLRSSWEKTKVQRPNKRHGTTTDQAGATEKNEQDRDKTTRWQRQREIQKGKRKKTQVQTEMERYIYRTDRQTQGIYLLHCESEEHYCGDWPPFLFADASRQPSCLPFLLSQAEAQDTRQDTRQRRTWIGHKSGVFVLLSVCSVECLFYSEWSVFVVCTRLQTKHVYRRVNFCKWNKYYQNAQHVCKRAQHVCKPGQPVCKRVWAPVIVFWARRAITVKLTILHAKPYQGVIIQDVY